MLSQKADVGALWVQKEHGMKWMGMLGLVASVVLMAPAAHANRAVRLMYEAPAATDGGPAVTVTFEQQREEKKGGKDPTVIANERGSYGIPLAVRSGKQKTEHAADVVPNWLVDVLKSAGYAATRGEAGDGPRVHGILKKLWGDQIPFPGGSRHQFSFQLEVQIWPAGATEPAWTMDVQAGDGTTTVMMRFDDPVEAGFVRAFDEATKTLVEYIGTPEFQAALPGGNADAAQAAAQNLGPDAKKAEAAPTAAVEGGEGADAAADDGVVLTQADLPKGFEGWDPGVYQWISAPEHDAPKQIAVGFIVGGIGAGLFIAGDQWATDLAQTRGGAQGLAPVGATFSSVAHIPNSAPNPQADWIAQAAVSEIMFSYGTHMFVPTFGITVPTLVAGIAGADIQTTKAVMGIAGVPSYFPAGIAMLNRFGTQFAPQWAAHQTSQDRWVHFGAGIFPLVLGIVDIAVGTVHGVVGVLYATNTLTARADERGLLAPPTDGRRGLANSQAWVIPMVTPTDDGLSFGLMGAF